MASDSNSRANWLVFALALLACFLLLGTRGLNEPDEGRYAEIAREMIERGDWLVPHLWFVPHLDKPPMTYWLVALSLKCFGLNAWAVRLPVALAGLSGVWAAFLFARSIAGATAARNAALILLSSLLYWGMARMLTTDIFLTQFIAWSLYFFWRSWRALDGLADVEEEVRAKAAKQFFLWHVASWVALAGGFLTKGPIALLIPFAAVGALLVFRRKEKLRLNLLVLGVIGGTLVFGILVVPWFATIFQTVPQAFDFMVMGQAVGHSFGTAIDNRGKPFYFFIGVLAAGFLPWTPLLGWLWRRAHWRTLDAARKDAWVMLTAWAAFTFVLFSFTRAKLPAYILPMFPALAVLVVMRWNEFFEEQGRGKWSARMRAALALLAILPMIALPITLNIAFNLTWTTWSTIPAVWLIFALLIISDDFRNAAPKTFILRVSHLALLPLFVVLWFIPEIETRLRSNQTLAPLGEALRDAYKPGDAVLVWGRLPQGLPFHAAPVISATNQPFIYNWPMHRVPFEFPGNAERMREFIVPDEASLAKLLTGERRVLVVGFGDVFAPAQRLASNAPPRKLLHSGEWELFSNH